MLAVLTRLQSVPMATSLHSPIDTISTTCIFMILPQVRVELCQATPTRFSTFVSQLALAIKLSQLLAKSTSSFGIKILTEGRVSSDKLVRLPPLPVLLLMIRATATLVAQIHSSMFGVVALLSKPFHFTRLASLELSDLLMVSSTLVERMVSSMLSTQELFKLRIPSTLVEFLYALLISTTVRLLLVFVMVLFTT